MNISEVQLDIIKEMVNIGSAHASNALSSMVNDTVMIEVPEISKIPITEVENVVPDEPGVIIHFQFTEGPHLHGIFYIKSEHARKLVETLTGVEPAEEELIDELSSENPSSLTASALLEMGNILAGAFANVVSQLTGARILTSIPLITYDHPTSTFDAVLAEMCAHTDDVLVFKTLISSQRGPVQLQFLLFPSEEWLKSLPVEES